MIIISSIVLNVCFSQETLELRYGYLGKSIGWSITETPNREFILVGEFGTRTNLTSGIIIPIDSKGYSSREMMQMFGDIISTTTGFKSIIRTSDGGFAITGWTTQRSPEGGMCFPKILFVKLDSLKNVIAEKRIGSGWDYGEKIIETSNGDFVILGYTGGTLSRGNMDIYFVHIDPFGNIKCQKSYGGGDSDRGHSIQRSPNGGYFILGETNSFGKGGMDLFIMEVDSIGDTIWTKTIGGEKDDVGFSLCNSIDGSFFVVGWTYSYSDSLSDVWLIHINSSGEILWMKTYGGYGEDNGYSVSLTNDNGLIIVGSTTTFGKGKSDIWLIKTTSSGDTLWTRTFGGTKNDCGYSVKQTNDGGFVITGYTEFPASGESDIYFIKTDSQGNLE